MQKIAAAALLLSSLTACGDQPVPVRIHALRADDGDVALVDEAMAVMDMSWEASTFGRGTIHLHLHDEVLVGPLAQERGGQVAFRERCWKSASAARTVEATAHEIGHLMGLDHVCEAPCPEEFLDNLMRGDQIVGFELTDSQRETIDKERRGLLRCIQ